MFVSFFEDTRDVCISPVFGYPKNIVVWFLVLALGVLRILLVSGFGILSGPDAFDGFMFVNCFSRPF